MESKDQNNKKLTQSYPLSNNQLQEVEIKHLINIIRQRYISPYKIIYMINQEEADLFKARNKIHSCCSSSQITIPKDKMTKTQLFLFQAIEDSLKINNLSKILQQIAGKYEKILKSGEKQNLKLDDQLQKFLIQRALSEGFNLYLYKKVLQKLKEESKNVSSGAILWATPQTWYAKYPNIPLNSLSSKSLIDLNSTQKGFANQHMFLKQFKDNLLKELIILQQDGKFEVQIYNKEQSNIRNDSKIMTYPERYCFDGSEDFYNSGQITYPFLKKTLIILRSIPFELNLKLNAYCTISENNQISYFKKKLIYKVKAEQNICSYKTFSVIGEGRVKCKLISKGSQQELTDIFLQSGALVLINTNLCQVELEGEGEYFFLFKSWISTLEKKK